MDKNPEYPWKEKDAGLHPSFVWPSGLRSPRSSNHSPRAALASRLRQFGRRYVSHFSLGRGVARGCFGDRHLQGLGIGVSLQFSP